MITIQPDDALLVIDLQNDFLPGGTLAVPQGEEIVPVLCSYVARFQQVPAPIFATRDWHPRHHCSFREYGGPWPVHCVAESRGAAPPPALELPASVVIVHKGMRVDKDAYSGFQDTKLDAQLRSTGVRRVFIGGLATDYCVLSTVKDALQLGYPVFLLTDASRAVNITPNDGAAAEQEMTRLGAIPITIKDVSV